MWWSNNDQAGPNPAYPHDRRAGRPGRSFLDVERLHHRERTIGTTASSRSRPTAGPAGSQQEVLDKAGDVVSTNDDPNNRLVDYGGLQNGLTGDSGGWSHHYVDLTP